MLSGVARVYIGGVTVAIDKPYDYSIAPSQTLSAKAGCRVLVPFGAGNRRHEAIIVEILEHSEFDRLKSLSCVLDAEPILTGEQLELALWVKDKCFCRFYDAARLMIPAGMALTFKMRYNVSSDLVLSDFSGKQAGLLSWLAACKKPPVRAKILEAFGPEIGTELNLLVKKGTVLAVEESVRNIKDKTLVMAELSVNGQEVEALAGAISARAPKQAAVLRFLAEIGEAPVREICRFCAVTPEVISTLAQKGFVCLTEVAHFRNPIKKRRRIQAKDISLTDHQQVAYEKLSALVQNAKPAGALLFGVTGSGKTQVMARLMDDVLAKGRSVILLLPEIALTPQAIDIFLARYGPRIALMHSGMSLGERLDEWKRVRDGSADVVIGTRSAVFAPVKNLGLIVMDEEQEHTYKSESSPKYHARDIARFRCAKSGAVLVMASATPCLETYFGAKSGRYTLAELPSRHSGISLPTVHIADMREELRAGNRSALSQKLLFELKETICRGEQAILFLNRRGHNTFVSCRSCGFVAMCPRCSVSLTFHSKSKKLQCHYCGYSENEIKLCPACGEPHIRYFGAGTQKIEAELQTLLPQAKILRMDADTTSVKDSYDIMLEKFKKGVYNILLGTQMVTKGLDFEKVTLVGVLAADLSLYIDDFRASERTFSQLTQVVGRAGRGALMGRAVIQTYSPDNPVIRFAVEQDFPAFYKFEIGTRRVMAYPPYGDVVLLTVGGPREGEVCAGAQSLAHMLSERLSGLAGVVGPMPARMVKLNGRYYWQVVLRCRETPTLRQLLSSCRNDFLSDKAQRHLELSIDINPYAF